MLTQHDREDFFKKELVEELRRVETMIRQAPTIEKKAYYFSAAYGVTNRTYRYSFSKDVLLADLLLQGVYNMIMERINAVKSGNQTVLPDPALFELIADGIRDLANSFEKGESILEPIEKIVTIGFTFTGAGNYLLEKKLIEL